MAKSKNTINILGRLGRDPEVRQTKGGDAIANLSVATDHSKKDANGDWDSETTWHRVVCFGRLAEIVGEYCQKGQMVDVTGRMAYRTYTDRDDNERTSAEIVARDIIFFSRSGNHEADPEPTSARQRASRPPEPKPNPVIDDDLPF